MPPWFRWQQNFLRIFLLFLQEASKNGGPAEKKSTMAKLLASGML
jgi:hypothetical protein